jgi:hypothetical protein
MPPLHPPADTRSLLHVWPSREPWSSYKPRACESKGQQLVAMPVHKTLYSFSVPPRRHTFPAFCLVKLLLPALVNPLEYYCAVMSAAKPLAFLQWQTQKFVQASLEAPKGARRVSLTLTLTQKFVQASLEAPKGARRTLMTMIAEPLVTGTQDDHHVSSKFCRGKLNARTVKTRCPYMCAFRVG